MSWELSGIFSRWMWTARAWWFARSVCLGSLFARGAELLHDGRAVILPLWSELSMKMSFLLFRRHWVAGGSECREHPWNTLLLAKDVPYSVCCKSLISNTQFQCILFWFVLQIGSRAVLITGCDSGFGFDLAKHLHDKGFIIYAGCLQKVGKQKLFFTCGMCSDT